MTTLILALDFGGTKLTAFLALGPQPLGHGRAVDHIGEQQGLVGLGEHRGILAGDMRRSHRDRRATFANLYVRGVNGHPAGAVGEA